MSGARRGKLVPTHHQVAVYKWLQTGWENQGCCVYRGPLTGSLKCFRVVINPLGGFLVRSGQAKKYYNRKSSAREGVGTAKKKKFSADNFHPLTSELQ